jgi:hypothetical protein
MEIQPRPQDFCSSQAVDFLGNGVVANAMNAAERLICPADAISAVV